MIYIIWSVEFNFVRVYTHLSLSDLSPSDYFVKFQDACIDSNGWLGKLTRWGNHDLTADRSRHSLGCCFRVGQLVGLEGKGQENELAHQISLVHMYLVQVQSLHFNESETEILLGGNGRLYLQYFLPRNYAMKQLAGG